MSCVLASGALVLRAPRARGDEERVIAVDIVSSEGCPDPERLLTELRQRLPPDVTVGSSASARRASVRLGPDDGGGFIGELTWEGQAMRPFRADACDTAARAILLSISLSASEPSPPPRPNEVTPPSLPVATPPPRPPPAPPPPSPNPKQANDSKRSSATTTVARARVAYGAVGRFFGAAGPANVALGGMIEGGLARDGVLQPSVRLSLTRSFASFPDAAPTTRITTTLARIDICPLRFASELVYATPCLGFDAGSLDFVAPYTEEQSLWLAPTILGRAGLRIFAPLGLEVAAGLELPLLPAQFYFGQDPFLELAYNSFDVGLLVETALVFTFP